MILLNFAFNFPLGYPFNPCLTEAQYKEMEEKVSSTLSGLEGELKGKFYPLTGMDKATQVMQNYDLIESSNSSFTFY